ncbi:MAG TPA: dihydrolipoamide acetyltransferase family protein [Solirubrobacteraceae bacterium]|nr:dihydrolipoamide acetyltransferase family protein [Solirubrobacteraceae bacterium]
MAVDHGRTLVEQSPMRRAIARSMTESKQHVPHFYVETEVAMDAAFDVAAELQVTVTVLLVKACALALRKHPELNAVWTDRGLELVQRVNVAVAVALDGGLIAPAVLGADTLSLTETAAAVGDLVTRARSGGLRGSEVTEATFTLSNLGAFDVARFTAIIVPPQVAILATGRTVETPVVRDGEITVQRSMSAVLSADHRALDGVDAARFLSTFKLLLQAPGELDV